MKKQTLCCIGHITLDKVVTPQQLIIVHMPCAISTIPTIDWLLP